MNQSNTTLHTHSRGTALAILAAAAFFLGSGRAARAQTADSASDGVERSVVKVFATISRPDTNRPWMKYAPAEVTGSGVVLEGRRILTNAHVVMYARQVQIQANEAGDKVAATVEHLAPGIDLAVLKLDDNAFFDTHPPLPRATILPAIRDSVLVYGFPQGGATLSITKGIVSRIEFTPYNYTTSGLRIQIDAAINPGNSGGPVVAGGSMVGIAFSMLGGANNIGYIIPCEEVELFLKDIADGRYDGKPAMFDELQSLENPAMRSFLKLDRKVEGIIVHKPADKDATYPIRQWDVITKIGDTRVDDEGMVRLDNGLRVKLQYMIQRTEKDGKVPLTVFREGKEMQVALPVQNTRPTLFPPLFGKIPSYFIVGPLVFSRASLDLFQGMWMYAALGSPSVLARITEKPPQGEDLVVICAPMFPHKLSKGYQNPSGRVVYAVNGIKVKSLIQMVEVLRDSKDEFVVFTFDAPGAQTLVFPRKDLMAATDEILNENGIRALGSSDVLAVWRANQAVHD